MSVRGRALDDYHIEEDTLGPVELDSVEILELDTSTEPTLELAPCIFLESLEQPWALSSRTQPVQELSSGADGLPPELDSQAIGELEDSLPWWVEIPTEASRPYSPYTIPEPVAGETTPAKEWMWGDFGDSAVLFEDPSSHRCDFLLSHSPIPCDRISRVGSCASISACSDETAAFFDGSLDLPITQDMFWGYNGRSDTIKDDLFGIHTFADAASKFLQVLVYDVVD